LQLLSAGAGVGVLAACRAPAAAPAPAAPAAPPAAQAPTAPPAADDPSRPVTPKLATLEQELAIPASLLEAARREGKVVFLSSIDKEPANQVFEVFRRRFPGIEPQYQEASEEARTVRTLTEFKAGRTRGDVVMGVGGFMAEYKLAKAMVPLDDLPALANYDPPYRDPQADWVGVRTQFWGIGYNTDKVRTADLPRSWEDLTDARWRGRIAVVDRPQLWAQQLWKHWGPERTNEFLQKLFANNPQRRKEGLDAAANLMAAGEFDLVVPAAPYRIQNLVERAATVGWFSPEPIPVAASEMVILQRSPNPNAAKVFVNWFISREGQAALVKADFNAPAHPGLRSDREYLGMFADSILGRRWVMRVPEDEEHILPEVRKAWQPLWTS
jgi:iron(III) transport system substrate-binding protein